MFGLMGFAPRADEGVLEATTDIPASQDFCSSPYALMSPNHLGEPAIPKVPVDDGSLVLDHVELLTLWCYVAPVAGFIQQPSSPAEPSLPSVVLGLRDDVHWGVH